MRLKRLWWQLDRGDRSHRNSMHRAASLDRQRIIHRVWSFEPLEDRALLAALSGLHNVGPTGDFTSIGAAISSIQSNDLDGPLTLELQPSYISTVEVYPLVFSNLGTTSVNTLTLRPELGATGLSITSDNTTAATVDLNGAQFLSIDGRPAGVGSHAGSGGGTASQLTIANNSTTGVAVRFINEASNNVLRYTTLVGVNTNANQGTVVFSTTTGANGNDNNLIDHCDIRDGASTPANGVYALGSSATVEQNNSGNTISNSNIFNFYSSSDATGVLVEGGNTDWTIADNSFYQTASRAGVLGFARAINVRNGSGNNFTVSGNFIGGSEPGAGGTPWSTISATLAYRFAAIRLHAGNVEPSNVNNNIVRNISWNSGTGQYSSLAAPIWVGIELISIGTIAGNKSVTVLARMPS